MGIVDDFKDLSTLAKVVIVVGVGILLVGLFVMAVVAMAVVGSFVLGIGGSSGSSSVQGPIVTFDYQYNATANELRVTHDGGDPLMSRSVRINGANTTTTWASESVNRGDTAVVSNVDKGDMIRIVWSEGDETVRIGEHTVS